MKHIVKQQEPQAFAEWKALGSADWAPTYRELSGEIKQSVKQALMAEQGYLCCYCERRLIDHDSHIEHFRPQNDPQVDPLDYTNLLCSCQNKIEKGEPRHCGNLKNGWFPKSINRLRLQGSASRFVHGGATLQELVIPVIKINKKRQSDLSVVEVDILRGASSTITSGQLAVVLYQAQAATEKIQGRVLRAGIYTQAGDLISDSHELRFDLTSDNPRDREMHVRFVLSRKADDCNGQEVILRVDEKLAGTSHYKEYKTLRYMVRRSFVSDFDF